MMGKEHFGRLEGSEEWSTCRHKLMRVVGKFSLTEWRIRNPNPEPALAMLD